MLARTLVSIILLYTTGAAAQPTLGISPTRPAPGAVVRLTLHLPASGDSIIRIGGTMSGEPLHFRASAGGNWHAIGPVKVDAAGDVIATAIAEHASGAADTVTASVALPQPRPPRRGGRPGALSVSARFTRPLDVETQERIDRENATAREIGRRAHDIAPRWTMPFIRPRTSAVTSRFGTGRIFNGTLRSRHLGVDFRGKKGAPVYAANRGVVALVDNFYLAGNVVYIDHGGGVVTAYFHLSKVLVAQGDTVQRGQQIGLVGATGRVTGPHLHWSARYGEVTINAIDLITAARP